MSLFSLEDWSSSVDWLPRWLPATFGGADHSHCNPRSLEFDWYEYTTSLNCNANGCRGHVKNYNASNPDAPAFEDEYVLAALDLGNGALGQLGLSYFDKPHGAYAVGTRQVLSAPGTATDLTRDCHDTYAIMNRVKAIYYWTYHSSWTIFVPLLACRRCM